MKQHPVMFAVFFGVVILVLTAVNVPIWRECRAQGFSAYYCWMQMK